MLVLSRKPGQLIRIGNNVEVTVLGIRGQRVLVGLNAPAEVPIRRQEVPARNARRSATGADKEELPVPGPAGGDTYAMYPTVKQVEDGELRRRVLGTLTGHGVSGLEPQNVDAAGGVVTVNAQFSTNRERLLCLDFCRHVAGVVRLVDETCVGGPSSRASGGG